MSKTFLCRLFVCTIGLLGLAAWTDPFPAPDEIVNSSLDEQEEIIRERIPSVVTIVNPVYNPAVRSYLNTYIYRRPEQTVQMIGWAAVYFPIFEKVLNEEGMPTDLKYLSIVESALNPSAISRSGASGLWQFMKPTARECGLKISSYVDERMDPEKSTRAAVRYLKQLYETFGNWELVMAAYNAGPGRIRSAIKRAGTDNYWEMARFLPAETQSYVPGFIAASYLMNFHTEHELIPVYPEMAMGELITVYIYEGMSVSDVAKRSGLTVEEVRRLNPTFVRNYIPASPAGYALTLPFAAAELFNSNRSMTVPDVELANNASTTTITIDGLTYHVVTTTKDYVVRSGDNLYSIAMRNKCSVRELMNWNGLHDSRLSIGQRLEIRFTTRELAPTVIEEPVVAQVVPATRNTQTVSSLSTLDLEAFPVTFGFARIDKAIKPVVQKTGQNTIVLQRRQSVRSALFQNQLTLQSVSLQDITREATTGERIRVN